MFWMCMGKINLRAILKSDEENLNIETSGIKTNNKIIYKENNITVTILIYDNKIKMNRVCNEYKINFIFEKNKKTTSTYTLFEIEKIFDLETKCNKLKINENEIEIEYELEGSKFSYLLKIGV